MMYRNVHRWKTTLLALMLCVATASVKAQTEPAVEGDPGARGHVQVPLNEYRELLDRTRQTPRPAPAAYALGQSNVSVDIADQDRRSAALVNVQVTVETFEDEWTLVPILPVGTALSMATANGEPVQLVQTTDGLAWNTDQAGAVTMHLRYAVNANRSSAGYALPVPLPRAAATRLNVSLAGTGMNLAIVPASNVQTRETGKRTHVTATLPATPSALISWRLPNDRPYVISRARYRGELHHQALIWTARFDVESFTGETEILPLIPVNATLTDVSIDGKRATVLERDGHFATHIKGRGMHLVEVVFQVPVTESNGPPQAQLSIPRVPVSQFELVLPGRKEVKVVPAANVVKHEEQDSTRFVVYVPMVDRVLFTWSDAVPDDLRARVRANASLYHVLHAEEGVLHGRATAVYEITHGESNVLELSVPSDTQVNRIVSPTGGVSDWSVAEEGEAGRRQINVFLDRAVSGEMTLDIFYERLLGRGPDAQQAIPIPLVQAINVHRQRGMVALLSGPELALRPTVEQRISRVGENQLPAFVRNQIEMTVAHTYKYTDPDPQLETTAEAPERKQGKFNAQVNTLISLGEVTMKGSATIEVDVKSGSIADLFLRLPRGVNVLGVSGPSLRTHTVREESERQVIKMEFTREMDGQFRAEVNYERIMSAGESELAVPTVSVGEAEVEHGRIAVEALTAVEVSAAGVEQLSSLDINELPQQLVFKTTNPILLAYRYVNNKPPFRLTLRITRHEEIDVQVAAIERAAYETLFTRDGLAVTTARFDVRNSRRQFLHLSLPAGSKVWTAFVDGKSEKPAHANDGAGDQSDVLIRMINSATGFPVEVVYATPVDRMGDFGTLTGRLPRPDMVVTHSRWDVFLPAGHRYDTPDSEMDLRVGGVPVNPRSFREQTRPQAAVAGRQPTQPLRVSVPTQGIHFGFEKLYANQSSQPAEFSVRYQSAQVGQWGLLVSLAGAVLLWIPIIALAKRLPLARNVIRGLLAGAVAMLFLSLVYLKASPAPASALSLCIAVVFGIWLGFERLRAWRRSKQVVPAGPDSA